MLSVIRFALPTVFSFGAWLPHVVAEHQIPVGAAHAGDRLRAVAPQLQATAGGYTVTLVLVDELSRPGVAAQIRRAPIHGDRIIVAVKRSALSPELVAAALAAVPRVLSHKGVSDAKTVSHSIRDGVRLRPVPQGDRARIESTIAQLLRAAPSEIPGVGRKPAITVTLGDTS